MTYEITIVGGGIPALRTIRRGRNYRTYEAALAAADRVAAEIERRGYPLAAHAVMIYGPGLGPDGYAAH